MDSPRDSLRLPPPAKPQVGIPRRFGIGSMMLLVAVFAVIFSVMKTLNTPAIIFGGIAVFFAGVGLSQATLFKGRDPRHASLVGGLVMGPIVAIGVAILGSIYGGKTPQEFNSEDAATFAVIFFLFGAPFGYLAGCVLAAVFLVHKEPDNEPAAEDHGVPEDTPSTTTPVEPILASVVPESPAPPTHARTERMSGWVRSLSPEPLTVQKQPHSSCRLIANLDRQVGMPRRFGIGTGMMLTAVFAVLFGILKMLRLPPSGFAAVAGFFAWIGLCQALLFKGRNPRAASVVGGMASFTLMFLVGRWVGMIDCDGTEDFVRNVSLSIIAGALLGYLAGMLLATVFLVWKERDDAEPDQKDASSTSSVLSDKKERLGTEMDSDNPSGVRDKPCGDA
ncbi:MAG: hypothetical protein ABFC96_18105 [Thermoguttaceae bacterium]